MDFSSVSLFEDLLNFPSISAKISQKEEMRMDELPNLTLIEPLELFLKKNPRLSSPKGWGHTCCKFFWLSNLQVKGTLRERERERDRRQQIYQG